MIKVSQMQRAISVSKAVSLIELGARLQVLEHEFTDLSRETLLDLYKEVHGYSPPKGMLPFSIDWYLMWQSNVHSSLFLAYYAFFRQQTTLSDIEVLTKAYDFYTQEVSANKNHDPRKPFFSITRAWMLLRLLNGSNSPLTTAPCHRCGGRFLVENHEAKHFYDRFVCGMCKPPPRAGKIKCTP